MQLAGLEGEKEGGSWDLYISNVFLMPIFDGKFCLLLL